MKPLAQPHFQPAQEIHHRRRAARPPENLDDGEDPLAELEHERGAGVDPILARVVVEHLVEHRAPAAERRGESDQRVDAAARPNAWGTQTR